MLKAATVLELFNALSPQEQEKCRQVIAAAPAQVDKKPRKKRPQLRPEHSTDALVYDLVVKQNGIRFNNTNLQAAQLAEPTR